MKKPIIGITMDYHIDEDGFQYSKYPWYALRNHYSKIVAQHNGIPFFLSYEHELIDNVLSIVDGILIPGGDFDIPPELYGQDILSTKVRVGQERAVYEIALMKRAIALDIPVLGICNGVQVLNVARGGTLIQDIGEMIPHAALHTQPYPKHVPSHSIYIIQDTKLSKLLGGIKECEVNSSHHQSIDTLGEDLVVSAHAIDGIVEAIELPSRTFVVGVQWHPEYGATAADNGVIKGFIESATKHMKHK